MQSSGGTIGAAQARRRAVNLLLSGPAGGLAAARHVGAATGLQNLLTFDMGGTSTDVALVGERPTITNEGSIGPYPGRGADGRHSYDRVRRRIDRLPRCSRRAARGPKIGRAQSRAGVLRPRRNRTDRDRRQCRVWVACPHPCGWRERCRCDADLRATLSRTNRARRCDVRSSGSSRSGIVAIANQHMAQALRLISLERGHDPRLCTLVSFGGAGGLHVCALADALEIPAIIVPAHCGVFSALGMLVADATRQLIKTLNRPLRRTRPRAKSRLSSTRCPRRGVAADRRRRKRQRDHRGAIGGPALSRPELHADASLGAPPTRPHARSTRCTKPATVMRWIFPSNWSTFVAP